MNMIRHLKRCRPKVEKLGKELGTYKFRVTYKNKEVTVADPNPELSFTVLMEIVRKINAQRV